MALFIDHLRKGSGGANTIVHMPLLLLLLALIGSFIAPYTARPATLTISQDEASQNYPRGVTFRFAAQGDVPIQTVSLLYGSDGLSCVPGGARQAIKITPGNRVSGEWEWELKRSGSISPGVRVWRQWLIKDANGLETLTEREWITLEDRRHSWRNASKNNVSVNWYQGDTRFGEAVLAEAQRSLIQIKADYDVSTTRTVQIWIYPEAQELRDTLIYVPEWTGGIALAEYNSTMLAMKPGDTAWMKSVIPHELTHLLMNARLFNCRGGGLPTWLNEGVAEYSERATDKAAKDELVRLLNSGQIQGLSALQRGFQADGDLARASYTYGGEVTKYMLQTLGREKFARLLDAVRDGDTFERALQRAYGLDTDGLDGQWRAANGISVAVRAATPTPPAVAAVRTPIPTIALPGINPPGVVPSTRVPTPASIAAAPSPVPAPLPTAAPLPAVAEPQAGTNWTLPALAGSCALMLGMLLLGVLFLFRQRKVRS